MQLNLITLGSENLYGDVVGSPLAGCISRARASALTHIPLHGSG